MNIESREVKALCNVMRHVTMWCHTHVGLETAVSFFLFHYFHISCFVIGRIFYRFLPCLYLLKTENSKYVKMFSRAIIWVHKFLLEKLVVANLMENSTDSVIEPENLNCLRKRSEPD